MIHEKAHEPWLCTLFIHINKILIGQKILLIWAQHFISCVVCWFFPHVKINLLLKKRKRGIMYMIYLGRVETPIAQVRVHHANHCTISNTRIKIIVWSHIQGRQTGGGGWGCCNPPWILDGGLNTSQSPWFWEDFY